MGEANEEVGRVGIDLGWDYSWNLRVCGIGRDPCLGCKVVGSLTDWDIGTDIGLPGLDGYSVEEKEEFDLFLIEKRMNRV